MTEHTPTPWVISRGKNTVMINGERGFVCFLDQPAGPEQEANAAFIVRACNAHSDLMALAEEAERATSFAALGGLRQQARAALAAAKGPSTSSPSPSSG